MPSLTATLKIELNDSFQGTRGVTLYITDSALFDKIRDLGYDDERHPKVSPEDTTIAYLRIEENAESSRWKQVQSLLENEAGLMPYSRKRFGRSDDPRCYLPIFKRQYSPQELEATEFMHLEAVFRAEIGEFETQTSSEEYVVRSNHLQNNKRVFGELFPFDALAVAEPLHGRLVSAGLVGLKTEPIRIVGSRSPKKPLWKLGSEVVMPPCLTTLLTTAEEEEPFTGDLSRGCRYVEDAFYTPVELQYARDAVARLHFDVAVSAERTGNDAEHAFRKVIVSQRFRSVILAAKVPGVTFVPVRLL